MVIFFKMERKELDTTLTIQEQINIFNLYRIIFFTYRKKFIDCRFFLGI
jgi:hypothetical protein